jgi:hypothetical protein
VLNQLLGSALDGPTDWLAVDRKCAGEGRMVGRRARVLLDVKVELRPRASESGPLPSSPFRDSLDTRLAVDEDGRLCGRKNLVIAGDKDGRRVVDVANK